MSTTPNFGFQLFLANWFDQHPGSGPIELANALLSNVDSTLGPSLLIGARVVVPISPAELKSLKASPKVILPSLGPGLIAREGFAVFQYIPATVDYTLGNATQLVICSGADPMTHSLNVLQTLPASILDGSSGPGNLIGKMSAINALVGPQSWFESQPLILSHDGSAEITSGDGSAEVTLFYYSVPV